MSSSLVAAMTGKPVKQVREDEAVPIPAGVRPQVPLRRRERLQKRVAAAMMGIREAEDDNEEAIIPGDAEPIDSITGPSGIKMDKEKMDRDRQPKEPDAPITPDEGTEELMTPRDALVAPDVTPDAFEPIDPSEVPAPKNPPPRVELKRPVTTNEPPKVDPMDVLLGRVTPKGTPGPESQEDIPVTVESAQSRVNAALGVGMTGEAALRRGEPMPEPKAAQPAKIMEAFFKYGPKRTSSF